MSSRLTHDEYFLQMLQLVSARSTCGRRAVGAIIVSEDFKVLATGYNGVPRNFLHCVDSACPGLADPHGDTRRCYAVHAEINAIVQCQRLDLARTMYTSCTPCFECAKVIANTPINRVISFELYTGEGLRILELAGVNYEIAKVKNA